MSIVVIFQLFICKEHDQCFVVAAKPDDIFIDFKLWRSFKPIVQETRPFLLPSLFDV